MFLHFKLASCGNELLILTFSNSKYSELKRKNQNNRTNMGHEDSTVLTGIAHCISTSTFFELLRSSYTMRTKCAISDAFVRYCAIA